MGYVKELYTELQETGWKEEDIKEIPDKLFLTMLISNDVKEKVKLEFEERKVKTLPIKRKKNGLVK